MDITCLSENIKNAFYVVKKTHENVEKLMKYLRGVGVDYGYNAVGPEFLRWRSDANSQGWCVDSFIVLFQPKNALPCKSENGWNDAPMYALEISFQEEPCLYLSRLDFDIESWNSSGIGSGEHWCFYWPRQDKRYFFIQEKDGYVYSKPRDEKASEKYWKILSSISKKSTFVDITRENVKEKIFEEFDKLAVLSLR